MLRLIERQLVTCTPRKNHKCEGNTKQTTKGVQPLGSRDSSLRHPFQCSSLKFCGNPPSVWIVGRGYRLLPFLAALCPPRSNAVIFARNGPFEAGSNQPGPGSGRTAMRAIRSARGDPGGGAEASASLRVSARDAGASPPGSGGKPQARGAAHAGRQPAVGPAASLGDNHQLGARTGGAHEPGDAHEGKWNQPVVGGRHHLQYAQPAYLGRKEVRCLSMSGMQSTAIWLCLPFLCCERK